MFTTLLLVSAFPSAGIADAVTVRREIYLESVGVTVSEGDLRAEQARLSDAWQAQIFSPEFREYLRPQSTWKHQVAYAMLMRYPDGPASGSAQGPGAYVFESQLNAAIALAPQELAPRVLMLVHCQQSQLETPADCTHRHGEALVSYHPDNAVGYLFLGDLARRQGHLETAAQWMSAAAERPRLHLGLWAIVRALYEVFEEAGGPLEDTLDQAELALFELSGGMLAHLLTAPHNSLNVPCQQAKDEPLLSICLNAARALKLPGTLVLANQLALFFEARVYSQRNDVDALAALQLERQALRLRQQKFQGVQSMMEYKGRVKPILDAWVEYGELDSEVDVWGTYQFERGGNGSLPVLAPSSSSRVDCLKLKLPATAPACVTEEMAIAEAERQLEVLDPIIRSTAFLDRVRQDPSAEAQVVLRILEDMAKWPESGPREDWDRPREELLVRFPTDPLASRIALGWCGQDVLCTLDVAHRIIGTEPEDAMGYLAAAYAQIELGQAAAAKALLLRSGEAKSMRTGFGLVVGALAQVIGRHMGPPPPADRLGLWPQAPTLFAFTVGAALPVPSFHLYRQCADSEDPAMWSACLVAAKSLQLPGSHLVNTKIGLAKEILLLERMESEADLAEARQRQAEIEALMAAMGKPFSRLLYDQELSRAYLAHLESGGEVVAIRWMSSQPPLEVYRR
ncbi:MAG: hypothetical protein AAGA23_01465 [Pseudomonadota bacterium]